MVARIKKNDTVCVISGKDKGKTGQIIAILPKKGKVVVKGVAVVTKHVKARHQGQVAGIKKEEAFIALTKVMPICSACNKPCRTGTTVLEDGQKSRNCSRCKEIF